MQSTCQHCQKPLYATQEFCLYCGNPISRIELEFPPTQLSSPSQGGVLVKRGGGGSGLETPWVEADPTRAAPGGFLPVHPYYDATSNLPARSDGATTTFPDPALGLYAPPPGYDPLFSPRPLASGPMGLAQASAPWKLELTKEIQTQTLDDGVEDSTWIREAQGPSAFDSPLLPPGVVTAEVPSVSPFSSSPPPPPPSPSPSRSSALSSSPSPSASRPSPSPKPKMSGFTPSSSGSRPDFEADSPLLRSRRSSLLVPALASFFAVVILGVGGYILFGGSPPSSKKPVLLASEGGAKLPTPPASQAPPDLQQTFQQAKEDTQAQRWDDAKAKLQQILESQAADEYKEQAKQLLKRIEIEEKGFGSLSKADAAMAKEEWGSAAEHLRLVPRESSAQTKARTIFQTLLKEAVPAQRKKAAVFVRKRKYASALQANHVLLQIDPGDPAARRSFQSLAARLKKLQGRCSFLCRRRHQGRRKKNQLQKCLAVCTRRFPPIPTPPPLPPPSPEVAAALEKRSACTKDCRSQAQTTLDDCRSSCKGRSKKRCRRKCVALYKKTARLCPRRCK